MMLENKIIILSIFPIYETDNKLIPLLQKLTTNGFKVVAIDDGNGDKESNLFKQVEEYARVLYHKNNIGKGASIKEALKGIKERYNRNTVVITLDWKSEITIPELHQLSNEAYANKKTLVIGKKEDSLKSTFMKTDVRAFNYELIDFLISVGGNRFEYEMNVLRQCTKTGIYIKDIAIGPTGTNENQINYKEAANKIVNKASDSIENAYEKLDKANIPVKNYFIDYGIFFCLNLLSDHLLISNIFARITSAILEFNDERANYQEIEKEAKEYLGTMIVLLIIDTFLLSLFVNRFHINCYIAKIFTEILFALFYYGIKEYIFKSLKK